MFAVDGDPGPPPILHISEISRTLEDFGGLFDPEDTREEDLMSDAATEILSDAESFNEQAMPIATPGRMLIHRRRCPYCAYYTCWLDPILILGGLQTLELQVSSLGICHHIYPVPSTA